MDNIPQRAGLMSLVAGLISVLVMLWNRKPKWNPTGQVSVQRESPVGRYCRPSERALQRCVVTGGSSGLGLAFAKLLISNGASVAIIARDPKKLTDAIEILEVTRP